MPIEAVHAPAAGEAAPTAAPSVADAKAARRGGALPPPAAPAAPAVTGGATSVAEVPGAKVQIDMTPEQLAAATEKSKNERAERDRVRALEERATAGETLAKAKALAAEGQHLAAVEMLGIDLNAAVAEQLGQQPAEGEAPDPKVAELQKKVDELATSAAARAKQEAEALQARTQAARAADLKGITDHVTAQAAAYPLIGKDAKALEAAYDTASDLVPGIVADLGRPMTSEEKHNLMLAALDEAEARARIKAGVKAPPARTGAVTSERPRGAAPPQPSARPTTFSSDMRGGTSAAVTKPRTRTTLSDAKRARRAN